MQFQRTWVLKKKDFWPRINMLKGNLKKKFRQWMSVRQILGIILENKVVQKLKLENNVFTKKHGYILQWKNKIKEFCWFLASKIDFGSTILALFDKPHSLTELFWIFSFEYVDSWPKILLFRTIIFEIPQPKWYYCRYNNIWGDIFSFCCLKSLASRMGSNQRISIVDSLNKRGALMTASTVIELTKVLNL